MICPFCETESENCTYCPNCGHKLVYDGQGDYQGAPVQPEYVVNNYNNYMAYPSVSVKNRTAALILAVFLGAIGIHRFYVGKVGTGLLWMFTGGCFGIGFLVDIILIACGSFKDAYGCTLLNW